MSIVSTFLAGCAAAFFLDTMEIFDRETQYAAARLNAFPARQTAVKIASVCARASCFGMALSCLALTGGSVYVMANRGIVLFSSSIPTPVLHGLLTSPLMRNVCRINVISWGIFLVAIPFFLYARPWQVVQ